MDTYAAGTEQQTSAQQTVTASPTAERLAEEKKDVVAAKTPADTSQPPLKKVSLPRSCVHPTGKAKS